MIATKYEEIYPPTLKDLIYITDNAYEKEDILKMETQILISLDFNIQQTSAFRFLERYQKLFHLDNPSFCLAQYFLELSLLDSKMNQFLSSEQAITALYAAKKIQSLSIPFSKIEKHTSYTE